MNNELISTTKKALNHHIWEFIGTNDLLAVNINNERYYVYCANTEIPLSIRIFKGEEGLQTLSAIFDLNDEKNDLLDFEDFMGLECIELNLFLEVDLEDNTKAEIQNQGFEVNQGSYSPLFSVAEKNILRRNLNNVEEVLVNKILNAMIEAKDYFSSFGKSSATSSFQPWFDSLNLKDSDKVDYIPLLIVEENKDIEYKAQTFDWFNLSPQKEEDALIEIPKPLVEEVKKATKNNGQILDFEMFLLTAPFVEKNNSTPKYPYAFLLLNKKTQEIVDLQLDFNLKIKQKEYPIIILDLFAKSGKPEAIHTYSERSYNFLSGILNGTGINVMQKKLDENFLNLALNIPELMKGQAK